MMRPAVGHVLQRSVGSDDDAAKVDVDHAVHLGERRIFKRFGDGRPCVVDEHIDAAEGFGRLFDSRLDCLGIGGIGLDGECFAATPLDRLHNGGCGPARPSRR